MTTETEQDRTKRRIFNRRYSSIAIIFWSVLATLNIQNIVAGDGDWLDGVWLTLDAALILFYVRTIWRDKA